MQLIPNNPLSDIYAKEDLQITKRSVDRTFSDEEIRMFWLAVDQSRITPSIEGYLKEAFELSAQNSYVFTNDGSDEVMGLRAALAIPYNIMQYLRKNEGYELAHFSTHDLRRTARSNFSSLTEFHVAVTSLQLKQAIRKCIYFGAIK